MSKMSHLRDGREIVMQEDFKKSQQKDGLTVPLFSRIQYFSSNFHPIRPLTTKLFSQLVSTRLRLVNTF